MTEKAELLASPEGEIIFMALASPVPLKYDDKEGEKGFIMRLKLDGTTADGKAFKQAVQAINPKIVNTNGMEPGFFSVKATSKFAVNVLDASGEAVEEENIPRFTKGSTGRGRMIVRPYTQSKLGGSIKLVGAQLLELSIAPAEETGGGESAIERLQRALKGG